jgi:hypothetical protein
MLNVKEIEKIRDSEGERAEGQGRWMKRKQTR